MKNFLNGPIPGISIALLMTPFIFGYLVRPSFINLVMNDIFWIGFVLFLECFALIVYLHVKRGASSRNALFVFGLTLIFAAAIMNSSFKEISDNTAFWTNFAPSSLKSTMYGLKQFIEYAKDVVGFGIAALGANLSASAMLSPKSAESSAG